MMIAQYTGSTLAGAGWTEIAAESFTSIGPVLKAPAGPIAELVIKSTTQPLTLRLGGIAASSTTGSLGRIVLDAKLGMPPMRKGLVGTVITYGTAKIRLAYHGRGDGAAAAAAYNYEIDMAYEPVPGTPRTIDELRAVIGTQLAALSGVGTATIKADGKEPGAIYVHDSAGPTAITVALSDQANGLIRVETPISMTGIPIAVADCPYTIEAAAEVVSLHCLDAGGATIVAAAKFES